MTDDRPRDDAPTLPDPGGPEPRRPDGIPEGIGAYRFLRRLGQGGYGSVYEAEHPILGRVAVKVLAARGEAQLRQFTRERTLALDHPAIPRILDGGEVEDDVFLVTDLVEGVPLASLLREGPMDEARAAALAAQVASALAHAHARGVVHRDVKPGNLVVGPGDDVHVLDFGIARVRSLPDPERGAIQGTPAFMSPEQVRGRDVGAASDVYSLGVATYFMLSRRLPVEAESVMALLPAVGEGKVVPIERRARGISPAFRDLLGRMLAADPRHRPPAADAARELGAIATGRMAGGLGAFLDPLLRGRGAMLLLTGRDRRGPLESLAARARELDVRVLRADAGLCGPRAAAAMRGLLGGPDPPPAAFGDLVRAYRRLLRDEGLRGTAILVVERVDLADDATTRLLRELASTIAGLPLLVVLSAPARDGGVAALSRGLSAAGLLESRQLGAFVAEDGAALPLEDAATLLRFAQEARTLGATGRAAELFGHVLADPGAPPEVRAEALLWHAADLRIRGRLGEARTALTKLLAAPHGSGREALAWLELGCTAMEEGHGEEARDLMARALRWAEEARRDGDMAACHNNLGLLAWRRGEPAEAARSFARAVELAGPARRTAIELAALHNRGVLEADLGNLPEARQLLEAALGLAREASDRQVTGNALMNLGSVFRDAGDVRTARAHAEAALDVLAALGDDHAAVIAHMNLGAAMLETGELESALETLLTALHLARECGQAVVEANALVSVGLVRDALGQRAEALAALEDGVARLRHLGQELYLPAALTSLAETLRLAGRRPEAVTLAREALALAERLDSRVYGARAALVIATCQAEDGEEPARDAIANVVATARELGARDLEIAGLMAMARAGTCRDAPGAAVLAAEAVRKARELGHPRMTAEAMRLWESLRTRPENPS